MRTKKRRQDQKDVITFELSYSDSDLTPEQKGLMLKRIVEDEARVLLTLPNDFTGAWNTLLKWRGISKAELAERIDVPVRTVSNIINGKTVGSIDTVVLMCLAAHLPEDMSRYLIERSGHTLLMSNTDHIWYSFALKHLYTRSFNEICSFFQDNGITTYLKIPKVY